MRKLKQAEDNEKKQSGKNSSGKEEVSFLQQPFTISFAEPVTINNISINYPQTEYHYTSQYLASIFRPPKQTALTSNIFSSISA